MTLVILLGLSSLAAYLLGARGLGLSRSGLRTATRATLEAVGLGALFLAANLALAVLAVALARAVTGGFVSVYAVDELALMVISLLQGVIFRWWRDRG